MAFGLTRTSTADKIAVVSTRVVISLIEVGIGLNIAIKNRCGTDRSIFLLFAGRT